MFELIQIHGLENLSGPMNLGHQKLGRPAKRLEISSQKFESVHFIVIDLTSKIAFVTCQKIIVSKLAKMIWNNNPLLMQTNDMKR